MKKTALLLKYRQFSGICKPVPPKQVFLRIATLYGCLIFEEIILSIHPITYY